MSGHLCLKWNNHSLAFLKSFTSIQMKERYCDSTIVCQGKYFPVHRIILSTCSAYFEEIFQRMHCQHPYIVFKDIEPKEMELLLNYMYQGEVNVVQEMLPSLIRAAEALRIRGLAEPDDLPFSKEAPTKKRACSSIEDDTVSSKKRSEETKGSSHSSPQNNGMSSYPASSYDKDSSTKLENTSGNPHTSQQISEIKQEPSDSAYFEDGASSFSNFGNEAGDSALTFPSGSTMKDGVVDGRAAASTNYSNPEGESLYFKDVKEESTEVSYAEQSSAWDAFSSTDGADNVIPPEITTDAISPKAGGSHAFGNRRGFPPPLGNQRNKNENFLDHADLDFNTQHPKTSPACFRQCLYCNYRSNKISNLKTHIRYKHTQERPFQCTLCSKRFVEKVDLREHIFSHTGEKPFQCKICMTKFRTRSSLSNHKNRCRV